MAFVSGSRAQSAFGANGSPESEGLERVSRVEAGDERNGAPEVPVEGGTGTAGVSPAASTMRDEMAVSGQRLLRRLPEASAERLGVSPAVLAESGMKKPIGSPMSLTHESPPEGIDEGARLLNSLIPTTSGRLLLL